MGLCVAHHFGPVNKLLAGKQFTTDTDMKQAVTFWLQTLDADFVCTTIQDFMPQWNKHLNVNRNYVEV